MFTNLIRSWFAKPIRKPLQGKELRFRPQVIGLESRITPTVTFYSIDATESLVEGETRYVTVRREGPDLSQRTVNVLVIGGTATVSKDFTHDLPADRKLVFDEGAATASIQINALDDLMYERPQETFRIVVNSAEGGRIKYGAGTCTVTIHDNDSKPSFSFEMSSNGAIREGDSNITVTLRLSNPTYEAAHLKLNYVGIGQYAKRVYDSSLIGVAGTYYFSPGKMNSDGSGPTKTFSITVKDDSVVEDTEQFTLTVTAGAGLQTGEQSATISILDNDIPNVAVLDYGSVMEGHANHQIFFKIKLVGQTAERPITVYYSTQDGSARAGEDYYAVTNGTATIQISRHFPFARAYVTIRGDRAKAYSRLEDFFVKLTQRAEYTISDDTGRCVIVDDDGIIR